MANNLDARHHFFACKRALAEAQKKHAAYMQLTVIDPRRLETLRTSEEYAERAMIDAHLDWAQAEREELLASSHEFRRAYDEMISTQKAAEKAAYAHSQLHVARGMAAQVFGEHASTHSYAATFAATVARALDEQVMRFILTDLQRLQTLAAHRGAACSKMFEAHIEALEALESAEEVHS